MIYQELENLEAEGRPIRVGVSGAGWIGSGFVQQCNYVNGMTVTVLADEDLKLARDVFINSGIQPDDIIEANTPGKAIDLLRAGKKVITGSYQLASQLADVDIVADIVVGIVVDIVVECFVLVVAFVVVLDYR